MSISVLLLVLLSHIHICQVVHVYNATEITPSDVIHEAQKHLFMHMKHLMWQGTSFKRCYPQYESGETLIHHVLKSPIHLDTLTLTSLRLKEVLPLRNSNNRCSHTFILKGFVHKSATESTKKASGSSCTWDREDWCILVQFSLNKMQSFTLWWKENAEFRFTHE